MRVLPIFLLTSVCACSAAPAQNDTQGCQLGAAGEPTELRCTGLYSSFANRTLSSDVQPFSLGVPLWSDGATKERYIYLPPGTQIDNSDMNEWVFPVGTKLWKAFTVQGELIETRLLWKQPTGWYRTSYRWDSTYTTTHELTTGELNANGLGYEVPSRQECDECHNGRKDGVLGFEAVSLSNSQSTGLTMTQLVQDNLLLQPAVPVVLPGSTLDQQALGFLHINCGAICHNESNGFSSFTGFWMRLDVGALHSIQDTNTWKTGVNVAPLYFSAPDLTIVARIAPGNPDGSCVHYRMSHRNDSAAMPPIDSHKVDDAAVQTITDWINSLQ